MKNNTKLYEDIMEKLEFDPAIGNSDITIAVKNGVITLGGKVKTYFEKELAEQAVKAVEGVKAVANELAVDIEAKSHRSDVEIAQAAVNALKWDTVVPADKIQVAVENGHVVLSGNVVWWHQKQSAELAIKRLTGVRDVTNDIIIIPNANLPSANIKDVKSHIVKEFHRNAQIDATKIQVEVDGHKVILKGSVRSWPELEEAIKGAWSALGVDEVDNYIIVE